MVLIRFNFICDYFSMREKREYETNEINETGEKA
jgi:hypothetical protein